MFRVLVPPVLAETLFSVNGQHHRLSGSWAALGNYDAAVDRSRCSRDRQRLLAPNEFASRAEHVFNASVHFSFVNELSATYLVNADLDLLLEPIVMRK